MAHAKTLLLAGFAALAFSGAAIAQTAEDQAACRDDMVKLCPTALGKPDDMKKCLVTHKDKLSATCKKTVEASR